MKYYGDKKSTNLADKMLFVLPTLAAAITMGGCALATLPQANLTLDASAIGSDSNFSVNSDLSLSITLPDTVSINLTPEGDGTFGTGNLDVTVSTNDFFGYTLNMYSFDPVNTSTSTTNLISTDRNNTISTLSGSLTGANFETSSDAMNKWGYSTDSGANFSPVTTGAMLVGSRASVNGASAAGTNTNTITFGTKVNNEIPNGTYSALLNFMAVTTSPNNASTDSSFERNFAFAGKTPYNNGAYYSMQDMNNTICDYTYTPTSASDENTKSIQLIDTRDGKLYWVTKLLDGKCWMTQNLDLNLEATPTNVAALTSNNTDIATTTEANASAGYTVSNNIVTWTPARSSIDSTSFGTIAQGTNYDFATGWTNDNDTSYSVDPGTRYVLSTKATTTPDSNLKDTFYNSLGDCQTAAEAGTAVTTTCNAHNSVGNYYNFAAANATNSVAATVGHTITNDDNYTEMPNSICPKNWRMPHGLLAAPTSGAASENNSEFDTLLYAYNVTGTTGVAADANATYKTTSDGSSLNAIRDNPLYFLRAGRVYGGMLGNAGTYGNVWSGTISSSTYGYYLDFDSTNANPAFNSNRIYGRTVRCVAR